MDSPGLGHLIRSLVQAASTAGHRRLLVFAGDPAWADSCARQALAEINPHRCLWLGESAPSEVECLTARSARQQLGTETDLLVVNAFEGCNPDALGALSGTLTAGGLMLLICPPLAQWPDYPDPDYARLLPFDIAPGSITGHFLQWLVESLRSDPTAVIYQQGRPLPAIRPVTVTPDDMTPSGPGDDCLTLDQGRAVDAVVQVVKGHRRRPLVIRADRGRGKSAALGIAAARLIDEQPRRILVTAPRRESVEPLFERLRIMLPSARVDGHRLHQGDASVEFLPPDLLLANRPDTELLLVDEAAAIPAPLLEAMLERYARVVYATTVNGYEGTGRGFDVRFKQVLDRQTPGWRLLELQQPIRWQPGDPLEAWLSRALLLDATIEPAAPATLSAPVVCRLWSAPQLLQQPRVLRQLFALLVQAHYRTTPADLRSLLDSPQMRIWVQQRGEQVVGVLLGATEGGFDAELSQQVWLGRRRPRGHLLPQVLAAQGGYLDAGGYSYLRVVRVAVHPDLQQQGLGSALLAESVQWASRQGVDMLGSSFGCTADLIGFWQKAGCYPLRLGLSRDASSGCHSLLVARPLSETAQSFCRDASRRFLDQFADQLPLNFSRLDPPIVTGLLAWGETGEADEALDRQDWLELAAFAIGHRGEDASGPVLRRFVRHLLGRLEGHEPLSALAVARVLQHRDWASLCRQFELQGRREGERQLREVLSRAVIARLPPNVAGELNIEASPQNRCDPLA